MLFVSRDFVRGERGRAEVVPRHSSASDRWSRRGFWKAMLSALAKARWVGEAAAIDATYVKAHRSAQGGKRGAMAQAIGRSRDGHGGREVEPVIKSGPGRYR
jgi:transposase